MRTTRRNVFETNSSSCHALAVYHAEDWEKLYEDQAFVIDPYSLDCKIVSMEEAKELVIDELENSRNSDNKEIFEAAYEKIREDDDLVNELIHNPDQVHKILGDDAFINSLDELDVQTYESAYQNEEFFPDEGEDDFVFYKDDLVIVSGQVSY